MRLGRQFKKLARRLPESEQGIIWSGVDRERVYAGYMELHKLADRMEARVDERCLFLVEKAREHGEDARYTKHSCSRPSCGICGGTRQAHTHLSGNKDENLESWLAKYLSAQEVLALVSLLRARDNLLTLLTYLTELSTDLGLLEGDN